MSDSIIDKRYEFVLLFDVAGGNPNGDPDAGNAPRMDPETNHGLVSDVCIKRKLRNYVGLVKTGSDGKSAEDGYAMYVRERAILNQQHGEAYKALKIDPKKPKAGDEDRARDWMCQTFFDVRWFGAVMTTDVNAGQVRGPVQVTFSRSIDPILPLEQSITRMAVTTEKEAEEQNKRQSGQRRTMGRKDIVPYGLYRCHGFVNPFFARQTGFDTADLNLLWTALQNMFEHDHSATRGEMVSRKLFVWEHASALGNAPSHQLLERIKAKLVDPGRPPRSFSDYVVVVDGRTDLPEGVTLHEMR